ncbi:hypothetical protein Bca52824_051500 [Brassica carinata]|uniref:Uncharacterized protein n=1 Tax=Brassica carinata TaxID=52824 RepID=A0A8X7R1A6_BRACI|nr:hypothetical protein Bca52824_051500 [Brassica carinata]
MVQARFFDLALKNLDSHLSFFEYRMMSSGCEDSLRNTMGIRGIPSNAVWSRTDIHIKNEGQSRNRFVTPVIEIPHRSENHYLPSIPCELRLYHLLTSQEKSPNRFEKLGLRSNTVSLLFDFNQTHL